MSQRIGGASHWLMVKVMVAVTWLCGVALDAGCGNNNNGGGGGGGGSECGMVEVMSDDGGGSCAIPACGDFDPDQAGMLGGDNAVPPGQSPSGALSQAISWNGCWSNVQGKPIDCTPRSYGLHKGGNAIHDKCADSLVPASLFPGADVVISGICFDQVAPDAKAANGYMGTEVKTAAYTASRVYGQRLCASSKRYVLRNVMATALKEAKPAMDCGYTYRIVFSDLLLEQDWVTLMGPRDRMNNPPEINIGWGNMPVMVTRDMIAGDLGLDLKTTADRELPMLNATIEPKQYCGEF